MDIINIRMNVFLKLAIGAFAWVFVSLITRVHVGSKNFSFKNI